jgi:crescentin
LDAAAARLRHDRVLTDQELGVLQKRLEQVNLETAQLGGRLAQVDEQLVAERRRVAELEAALLAAHNDSTRAARLLEGRMEVQRAAQSSVEGRLEAALARIAKLDELNMGLTSRLAEAALRASAAEDERAGLVQAAERAEALARTFEQEAATLRREFLSLEAARAAAVERADELGRLAQSRDTSVKRAERQIAALKERVESSQADHARMRTVLDERLNKMQSQFERERAERAIAEGALETARRDRNPPERTSVEGNGARETA